MLPAKNRISRKEISFYLKGISLRNAYFRVVIGQSKDTVPHVAIVIPKKEVARAVDRNKVRRRLYRAFQLYFQSNKANRSFIVFPSKKCTNLSQEEINKLIFELK